MTKRETKLYFDQDLWRWLQKVAKKKRCSVSHLVRDLVMAEMQRQQAETQGEG